MTMPKPYSDMMQAAMDGELTPGQQAQFEQYLAESGEARAMWNALTEVDALLSAAPLAKPRPGFGKRFEARLAGQRSRVKTLWGTLALGTGTLMSAAALSLLVATYAFALTATGHAQQPSELLSMRVTQAAVAFADARALINALSISALALGEWGLMQPTMWLLATLGLGITAVWLYLIRKLSPEVTIS